MRLVHVIALSSLLLVTLVAGSALAQCQITGTIESEMTADPSLPAYTYTMTVEWMNLPEHGLSHFDLQIELEGGNCTCDDITSSIVLPEIAGTSYGVPDDCMVEYESFFECQGDPSIPGVGGILIKYEPIEGDCEPDVSGTATVVFYSDYGPAPIDETVITLYDKFSGESCAGYLSGDFPALDCDPVENDRASWGGVKGLYR